MLPKSRKSLVGTASKQLSIPHIFKGAQGLFLDLNLVQYKRLKRIESSANLKHATQRPRRHSRWHSDPSMNYVMRAKHTVQAGKGILQTWREPRRGIINCDGRGRSVEGNGWREEGVENH